MLPLRLLAIKSPSDQAWGKPVPQVRQKHYLQVEKLLKLPLFIELQEPVYV
jgi:hypothetical protein